MKLLIKILILLPFFNFSQLNFVDPESQGMSKDRVQMISDLSKRYVDDGMVANITTMVNRNGKIVYFESFGKRGFDDNKDGKLDRFIFDRNNNLKWDFFIIRINLNSVVSLKVK